ncbi:hypothetical protein NUW58_g8415 [Xylaria curta]|uniref:Uncharacterized protein n=1 Tax=Xylaria curta TaxID=42375 RepID=A0ACC1N8L5_9PEZI|nr:hypothetical protein NUW58_g8415 [Xylaria curta]
MERRVQGPLLGRIAQHLETLPFELIDPILKELTFFRTLDLFNLPGTGLRVREAIRYHSRWAHLLGDETDEIEYLWTSLGVLARAQYRRPWAQVMAYKFESMGQLSLLANPNQWTTKNYIIVSLRNELRSSIFTLIGIQIHKRAWIATPELQAIFCYLPTNSTIAELAATPGEGEYDLADSFAQALVQRLRGRDRNLDMSKIVLELETAYAQLFQEQSAELARLADLYEHFSRFLKVAGAPELPTREKHVLARLRQDATRRRRIPGWNRKEVHVAYGHSDPKLQHTPYRFRYPHPTLVPFEWCLRLFKVVVERRDALEIDDKLPPHLKAHFKKAADGLEYIYCRTPGKRLKRTYGDTGCDATFTQYPFSSGVLPKPKEEIDWLESFVTVTKWMATAYPDIANSIASTQLPILRRRLLADPSDYRLFVEHESPRSVARQLRADLEECRAGFSSKLPTFLALYMPPWPSPRAVAIAQLLAPYRDCSHDLLQLLYESKISEICRHLKGSPAQKESEDGRLIAADEIARDANYSSPENIPGLSATGTWDKQVQHGIPERDLVTTANTLQRLFKETTISADESGSDILAHLLAQIEISAGKQNTQDDSWKSTVQNYATLTTSSHQCALPAAISTWLGLSSHYRLGSLWWAK